MKLLIFFSHRLKTGVVSPFAWLWHFKIHAHVFDSLFTLFISYIVREVLLVRERERYRERERERERESKRDRRKWRHHCRAKIGDEYTLSLAKNSHNWRLAYTFPCRKFALFVSPFTLPVSPFTERSPWWRWNSQWVHTFHCQIMFSPSGFVPPLSNGTSRATGDRKPKTNDQILPSPILFFPSKNWINTKNYWK